MPELPEVETVRRGLAPHLEGARIEQILLHRPNLRFPFPEGFVEQLAGQTIAKVNRRAKYLLIEFTTGVTLLSHLGMSGNFRVVDGKLRDRGKHDHVEVQLVRDAGTSSQALCTLIYSDPRRFGFMDIFADQKECSFLNKLGPEPLSNALSAIDLAQRFAGRKTPMKSALLDQQNIAGLGNIYVCEALWRAGIHPRTPAGRLVASDGTPVLVLEKLLVHIREVLEQAILAGGSTLKDFHNTSGEAGYFQHNFDVYGREGQVCNMNDCDSSISRIVQSGRSTFFCENCQPEIS